MVAGFLLYAPRRPTIFEAQEHKGVAGMSTVAFRSSSGWSYPVLSAGALTGTLAVHEAGPAGAPKTRLLEVLASSFRGSTTSFAPSGPCA
jgi:hypothetical protein